ncbi:MAG: hypothetical protein OSA98_18270 [Rubripirellula sp.]|nr:hypothetical protein [Rubripirellula sp.]
MQFTPAFVCYHFLREKLDNHVAEKHTTVRQLCHPLSSIGGMDRLLSPMRDQIPVGVFEMKRTPVDIFGFPFGSTFQASPLTFFNLLFVIFDHLPIDTAFHRSHSSWRIKKADTQGAATP